MEFRARITEVDKTFHYGVPRCCVLGPRTVQSVFHQQASDEALEWNSKGATSGYEGSYKLNRWFESNPPGI